MQALEYAKANERIQVVVLQFCFNLQLFTGNGDFYSSGNDLSAFLEVDLTNKETQTKMLEEARFLLQILTL